MTISIMTDADILGKFGKRIRELRTSDGRSQEDFAAECELHRTYYVGVERGKRNIALRNIERIATALGVTISELVAGL